MNEPINPATIGAPAAAYSLATASPAGSRWLHTSGIVGTHADGSIDQDLAAQASQVWFALGELCKAGGFSLRDTVSYTTYVVQGNDLAVVMAARDRALEGHTASSTLVVVPALARPEWKMEISLIAARSE